MKFKLFTLVCLLVGISPLVFAMNSSPEHISLEITKGDVEYFLKDYLGNFVFAFPPLCSEEETREQAKIIFQKAKRTCPKQDGKYLEPCLERIQKNLQKNEDLSANHIYSLVEYEIMRQNQMKSRLFSPTLHVKSPQTAYKKDFFTSLMPEIMPKTLQGIIDVEIEFYRNLYLEIDHELLPSEVKKFFDALFFTPVTLSGLESVDSKNVQLLKKPKRSSFTIPPWFWIAITIDCLLGMVNFLACRKRTTTGGKK